MYVSDTNKHICMCMYAGMCVGVTADECVHMCMCVYLELSYRGIMILPKPQVVKWKAKYLLWETSPQVIGHESPDL